MKHEATVQFKTAQKGANALTMLEAIASAKTAVQAMTGQDVDSIAKCALQDESNWVISVDVIESLARMGDNDFLATYEVQINPSGELVNFSRLRRYHREDQDG